MSAAILVAPQVQAAYSCAEQLRPAKRHLGELHAQRPHMGVAARHIAAAEATLEQGDEARCLEALEKAEVSIRTRGRGGHDR